MANTFGRDDVEKWRLVLRGFTELDDEGKQRFLDELQRHEKRDYFERRDFERGLQKITLGPVDRGCPCCGR